VEPGGHYLFIRDNITAVAATIDASNTSTPSDTAVLAERLLDAMSSVRRVLRQRGRRPVELSQLTGAELELVRLLNRRPGLSVAQAAEELRVAPNTISTLVSRLTASGTVRRQADGVDRRVARLDLDPPVRRTIGAWRDRRASSLGDALTQLSSEDRSRLDDFLPVLEQLAGMVEQ
jgi:DNA-binding MarR family transcriptional regulator